MPPSQIPNQDDRNLDKRADALLAAPEDVEALSKNWKEITRKSGLAAKPMDQRLDRARSAACTMLGLSDNEINRGRPAVERIAAAMEGKAMAPDEELILKQQKAGKFILVFGACMAFGLLSIFTGVWWLGFLLVCGAASMAWIASRVRAGSPQWVMHHFGEIFDWISVMEKDFSALTQKISRGADESGVPAKNTASDSAHSWGSVSAPAKETAPAPAKKVIPEHTEFGLRPEEFERPNFDLSIKK